MDLIEMGKRLIDIPNMSFDEASLMTQIITENEFESILELGFNHGVSSCYIAGALKNIGKGKLTTIDLQSAEFRNPNIDALANNLGLREWIKVYYEPTSYNWRLMKFIEENQEPIFDMCYIDGAHNWFVDGFSFFLVDKLLKPGGLIIFDDMGWTYGGSDSLKTTDHVKRMPIDERNTPQVKLIFDLLVKRHSNYERCEEKDGWGYAWKNR